MAGPRRPSASSVCCAANSITGRDCPGPIQRGPKRATSVTHLGGRGRGTRGHSQHQPVAAEGPTRSGTIKFGREAAKSDRSLPFPGPGAAARTGAAMSWSRVGPSRCTRRRLSDVGWQGRLDGTRSEAGSYFRTPTLPRNFLAEVTHTSAERPMNLPARQIGKPARYCGAQQYSRGSWRPAHRSEGAFKNP